MSLLYGLPQLLQRGGGPHCGVVELGALWLCVKALCGDLLGVPSPMGATQSGRSMEGVFAVGLQTGVPCTGGEWHGDARGEMVEESW